MAEGKLHHAKHNDPAQVGCQVHDGRKACIAKRQDQGTAKKGDLAEETVRDQKKHDHPRVTERVKPPTYQQGSNRGYRGKDGRSEECIAPVGIRLGTVDGDIAHEQHGCAQRTVRSQGANQGKDAGKDAVLLHSQQPCQQSEIGSLDEEIEHPSGKDPACAVRQPAMLGLNFVQGFFHSFALTFFELRRVDGSVSLIFELRGQAQSHTVLVAGQQADLVHRNAGAWSGLRSSPRYELPVDRQRTLTPVCVG